MMTKQGKLSELLLSNLNGQCTWSSSGLLDSMYTYVPWLPPKVLSDVVPKLRSLAKRYGGPCICNQGRALDVKCGPQVGISKIEELFRLHLNTGTLWRRNGVFQPPFLSPYPTTTIARTHYGTSGAGQYIQKEYLAWQNR